MEGDTLSNIDQLKKSDLFYDLGHHVNHIIKALGPIASAAEHMDHGEDYEEIEAKRFADLVIHAAIIARNFGFDVDELVKGRINQVAFGDNLFNYADPVHGWMEKEP